MTHYEFHEYANIFPMLDEKEMEALRADVEVNGQINRIILYQGKILDGRNRYTVCEMLGIEPDVIEYPGDDPIGLVLSQNLHRRHLTTSQRAIIAAKLAGLPEGRPKKTTENSVVLPSDAAKAAQFKVSEDSIQQARKVIKNAVPEVVKAVESGKLTVSAAATLVEKPPEQQRTILAKSEQGAKIGKDGKIRPAEYKKRTPKKTVAQEPADTDFATRYREWYDIKTRKIPMPSNWQAGTPIPEQNEEGILKIPLPLRYEAIYSAIVKVFRNESEEVKKQVIAEFKELADIIDNLND